MAKGMWVCGLITAVNFSIGVYDVARDAPGWEIAVDMFLAGSTGALFLLGAIAIVAKRRVA